MNDGHDIYRYIGCRDLCCSDDGYWIGYWTGYCSDSDSISDIIFGVYLDGIFQDVTFSYCASWEWVNIMHIVGEWVLYVQGVNTKWDYDYSLVLLSCYCGMLFRYCLSETRTFDAELCIINTIGFDVL